MSVFQSGGSSSVSESTENVYRRIKDTLAVQEVPEFFSLQGEQSETVLLGSVNLVSNILVEGLLPRVLKEMIFYTVSAHRECKYCSAIHADFCKNLGVDDHMLSLLRDDVSAIEPIRTRLIIEFALKCALSPLELVAEDYQKVRDVGICDAELMEVLATAACTVYTNTMADSLKVTRKTSST